MFPLHTNSYGSECDSVELLRTYVFWRLNQNSSAPAFCSWLRGGMMGISTSQWAYWKLASSRHKASAVIVLVHFWASLLPLITLSFWKSFSYHALMIYILSGTSKSLYGTVIPWWSIAVIQLPVEHATMKSEAHGGTVGHWVPCYTAVIQLHACDLYLIQCCIR